MRMIPTHCLGCGRLALTWATLLSPDGSAKCQCGAVARALPGGDYGPEDLLLFDAVALSLEAEGVTRQDALRLLVALESCRTAEPRVKLRVLEEFGSVLSVIELVAWDKPAVARKAIGLFELLLEAITHSESPSGVLPVVPVARRRESCS